MHKYDSRIRIDRRRYGRHMEQQQYGSICNFQFGYPSVCVGCRAGYGHDQLCYARCRLYGFDGSNG